MSRFIVVTLAMMSLSSAVLAADKVTVYGDIEKIASTDDMGLLKDKFKTMMADFLKSCLAYAESNEECREGCNTLYKKEMKGLGDWWVRWQLGRATISKSGTVYKFRRSGYSQPVWDNYTCDFDLSFSSERPRAALKNIKFDFECSA